MGKFISFPPSNEQSPRYPSSVTEGGGTTEDGGWKEMAEVAAPDAEEVDGKAADGEDDERGGGSGVAGADDVGVLITPFDMFVRASVVESVDAADADAAR